MTVNTYNAMTMGIGIAVLFVIAVAIISFILMVVRWRAPQRRGHVVRLLMAMGLIPFLIGIHQALFWLVFLPALGREQTREMEAYRAEQLARTSLIHVGDPAPDFALTDVDGSTLSMVGSKGKVVIINFFATWCGPCQLELPYIEQIWADNRDRINFRLLVIGREETINSVRDFRSKKGFSFPIAADPDRRVYSLFAKELIPRTIIISPQGKVVYSKAGFDEQELRELRSILREQTNALK